AVQAWRSAGRNDRRPKPRSHRTRRGPVVRVVKCRPITEGLRTSSPAVEDLVDPRHSDYWDTWSRDGWEAGFMPRQICPLCGFLGSNSFTLESRDFSPDISKVVLEVIDLCFIRESLAMTRDDRREIELLELF